MSLSGWRFHFDVKCFPLRISFLDLDFAVFSFVISCGIWKMAEQQHNCISNGEEDPEESKIDPIGVAEILILYLLE